jgi:nicotinamide riboside transporter PnuC
MLDIICQVAVAVLGVIAMFLVARKNRWGFVVGLISQPFWYITTYLHHQWGVFALSVVYTATWIYGIYEWFFKKKSNETIKEGQPS